MLLPRIPAEVVHLLEALIRGVEPRNLPLHPRPRVLAALPQILLAGRRQFLLAEQIDIMFVVRRSQHRRASRTALPIHPALTHRTHSKQQQRRHRQRKPLRT